MSFRVAVDYTKQLGRIRFTAKDYQSLRDEMIGRIPVICVDQAGNPKWTDFNSSDIGITILELLAGVGTTMLWHLDNAANEAFLVRARQRKNVISHCRTVGYRISHVQSSVATVTLSLLSPHAEDIIVPRFAVLRTSDPPLSFAVARDYVWAAGESQIEIAVKQGIVVEENFAGTGLGSQRFRLTDLKVGQNTVSVEVNGIDWAEVSSFVAGDSASEMYMVETDDLDHTYVLFGNGYFGRAPIAGAQIKVKYLRSAADDGNVGSDKIRSLGTTLYDVLGSSVSGIAATNSDKPPRVVGTVSEPFANIVMGVNDAVRYRVMISGVEGSPVEIQLDPIATPSVADIAADLNLKQSDFVAGDDGDGHLLLTMSGAGPSNRIALLQVAGNAYATLGFTRGITSGLRGAATGGAVKETIESARRQAPPFLQALDRAVTKWDYQAFMNAWPGVAKSQCWGEQEVDPPNYDLFNKIRVTFVPEGGGSPSSSLVGDVREMLERRKVVTTKIEYVPPVFIDIDISATVYLNPNFDGPTVKAEVTDVLNSFLDENFIEFQEDVRFANVVRLIDGLLGVHHCHVRVNGGVDDVTVGLGEIAQKGMFSITMVARSAWED